MKRAAGHFLELMKDTNQRFRRRPNKFCTESSKDLLTYHNNTREHQRHRSLKNSQNEKTDYSHP